MKVLALATALLVTGTTIASAQYGRYRYERDYYESRRSYSSCVAEKRRAEAHYYSALRRKGFLDSAEEAVQRRLQNQYDACRAGYGGRRYW
jgi:hypothetical protein